MLSKDNGKKEGSKQGKRKETDKVNEKDSGGVRDLMKVEDQIMEFERGREKGKSHIVKPNNTSILISKSTKNIMSSFNIGASSSLRRSLKRKFIQIKSVSSTTTKILDQRKEKRMYSLPGQKHEPLDDRDPLRIFYSTLRDQMPQSAMAEFWLMEYGLLPQDEAKKALERKQRQGQWSTHGAPSKSFNATLKSRFPNGSPTLKICTSGRNDKGKDVGTSSKGKNKKVDSESDSDEFLFRYRRKKKLKL